MCVAKRSVSRGDVFVDCSGLRQTGSRLPRFTRLSQGDNRCMGACSTSSMPLMGNGGLSTHHTREDRCSNDRPTPESHSGNLRRQLPTPPTPIVAAKSTRVNLQSTARSNRRCSVYPASWSDRWSHWWRSTADPRAWMNRKELVGADAAHRTNLLVASALRVSMPNAAWRCSASLSDTPCSALTGAASSLKSLSRRPCREPFAVSAMGVISMRSPDPFPARPSPAAGRRAQ